MSVLPGIVAASGGAGGGGPAPSGPSSTQWRIVVDDSGHPDWLSIQEIEMAETAGGANQCTGGTPSSGANRTGFTPAEAFDGDKTSTLNGWSIDKSISDKNLWWIQYTFASAKQISGGEVRLFARQTEEALHMPISWRLQYHDGSDWVTAWNIVYDGFWDDEETRTFTGSVDNRATGSARYWRLWTPYSDNGTYVHIAEIEMRATVGGADVTTTGNAISGGNRTGFEDTKAFDNTVSGNNSWGIQTSVVGLTDRWVGQDFGSAQAVVEVEVTARADSFPTQNPYCFYVEQSDDNITWNPVWYVETTATWTASEARVFTNPDAFDVLKLTFENGTDGLQDATDESDAATTLTWTGSSHVDATEVREGTLALDINSDTLSGDKVTFPKIAFGTTGDFTLEFWAYSTAHDGTWWHGMLGNFNSAATDSWGCWITDTPNAYFHFGLDGGIALVGTTTVAINEWHHYAVVREGTVWTTYLDGVQQATTTTGTQDMDGVAAITLGGNDAGSNDEWRGYLDMVRVTDGFARYTVDFIPPDIF